MGRVWHEDRLEYPKTDQALELAHPPCESDTEKEIDLLALRNEVTVLRRRVKHQSFEPAAGALLAALSRVLPAFGRVPETPQLVEQLREVQRHDRLGG